MCVCIHVCEREQHWCYRNLHAWSHLLLSSSEPKHMSALKLWGSEQTSAVSTRLLALPLLQLEPEPGAHCCLGSQSICDLPAQLGTFCLRRNQGKIGEGEEREGKERKEKEEKWREEKKKKRRKERKEHKRKMASLFLPLSNLLIVPPIDRT